VTPGVDGYTKNSKSTKNTLKNAKRRHRTKNLCKGY